MSLILGIDTSNYTTSCALYDTEANSIIQRKQLLPVKSGECGIRQSDAVFHHTRQLPELLESLFADSNTSIDAISVSTVPRRQEGSYMPCFTVGSGTARSISSVLGVPLFDVSHQQGHIAAALFSADAQCLFGERFLAFHVSGGTTEAILVSPDKDDIINCSIAGRTLDLNAGQLVDRIGVMLGLDFPCGKELEKLAQEYCGKRINAKAVLKGSDCCLSGFENKLRDVYAKSADKSAVAMYTLMLVEATVAAMTESIFSQYGKMPVVYAGGVMSNRIIRNSLEKRFDAIFAEPEFSCDNAAGVALLGAYKFKK